MLPSTCDDVMIAQRVQEKVLKTDMIAGPKTEYGPTVRKNVGYRFLSERVPDVHAAET